ncbi:MAG: sigma-54-dependent Fis family transcriptional regulator [Deltaproteobacteria bacterium]|nr:sigma-54-dependent Fis family transcriptional regulator [Deltaproteobacteria bacterium]
MTHRVLVVDDENLIRWSVCEHFTRQGLEASSAGTGEAALDRLSAGPLDAMVLDVRLPGIDGVETLTRALALKPDLAVVMISAHATVDLAVRAMKVGAIDFVVKPFALQALDAALARALSTVEARRDLAKVSVSPRSIAAQPDIDSIVGVSPAMEDVRRMAARCAAADATTVLIEGESGVGKEVVTRAIHAASPRAKFPFLQINCAAIPEHLVESELFGHERGAFTGAQGQKRGMVESADGGTVFLDEVGEMQLAAQAKLLQLLENRTFRRVGGVAELRSNVRIVAATNRNLVERVSDGEFRPDLYYRLNVVKLRIPPLRDRTEDIPVLAAHILVRLGAEFGRAPPTISAAAADILAAYAFPGNVRELRNALERAMVLRPDAAELTVSDFALDPTEARITAGRAPVSLDASEGEEHALLIDALQRTGQNVSAAARLLGVSRDTMRYRMKKYGLG